MERKARVKIDWSLWDSQLGKASDKELAEKIGSSVAAVSMRRRKLGVKASGGRAMQLDWAQYDSLLGTMEDKELASKMGCSIGSIAIRRKNLGVAAFNQRKSVEWELWDEFIPEMSDVQLAKKIGCAPGSVKVRREKLGLKKFEGDLRKKVDWDKWGPQIGVMDDKDLALMIGCTVGAINAQRKKMDIGYLSEKEKVKRSTAVAGAGNVWSKWDHMLGKCPDDVLASLMGVNRSKVGVRRMRQMIANYTLDWSEGDRPCMGGCGSVLSDDLSTCDKGSCNEKWAELSS